MSRLNNAMAAFVFVMSLAAAAFWISAILSGGPRAIIARIEPTLMVLFTIGHLPAMAASILLWRAGLFRGRNAWRAGLLGSVTYFSAACIIAVLGNALAASVLGLIGL